MNGSPTSPHPLCPVCAAPLEGRAWCVPCLLRGAVGQVDGTDLRMAGISESPGSEAGGGVEGVRAAPRDFGDYRLGERLGEGGMGVVYRAHKVSLRKDVAIKFIKAGRQASDRQIALFLREAELASQLDHPNIIGVSEVGDRDGVRFLVMRYVDGEPLSERLADPGFCPTVRERVGLLVRIARAVHHAHQRGVIHRDLKPGNILIDRAGEPHVGDFGLARWAERDTTVTVGDRAVGTPAYMPPEQARGRRDDLTIVSDVWSLGVVLYQMLSGRLPFEADSMAAMVHQILEVEPASPFAPVAPVAVDLGGRERQPAPVDAGRLFASGRRDLESICARCLGKEPGRRYPSAHALAEDLERWLDGRPVEARPARPWERLVLWARRRPALAGLAVVSCLAFAALGWSLWQREVTFRTDRLKRQFNYVADLNLARQALSESNFVVFDRSLSAASPAAGEEDLRGIEWGLLRAVEAGTTHPAWFRAGEPLRDIATSPSGGRVAVVGDRDVILLDEQGQERRRWALPLPAPPPGNPGAVQVPGAIRFSPDGAWLLVGSAAGLELLEIGGGGRIRLWDRPVSALRVSPAGDRLAVVAGEASGGGEATGRLLVFDLPGRRLEQEFERPALALAWSADGRRLRVAGPRGELSSWETGETGFRELLPAGYWSPTACLSPGGRRLARTSRYGVLHVLDGDTGVEERVLSVLPVEGIRMAFSGDDGWLAMTTKEAAVQLEWLGGEGRRRLYPGHLEAITALAFGAGGDWLVSCSLDGTVRRMSLESRPGESFVRIPHRLPTGAGVAPVFSPDGRWIALLEERAFVAPHTNEFTLIWDTRASNVVGRIPSEVVGWAGEGRVMTWDRDGRLRVWDAGDPAQPRELSAFRLNPDHDLHIDSKLADGGRWVVSLSRQEEAQAFEVGTGRIRRLAGTAVDLLATSPVGDRAAVGVVGGGAMLWHIQSGRRVRLMDAVPADMRFSGSGDWLAVTDWDRQLRLFDGRTGEPRAGLRGHLGPVTAVAFSPDERRLVTGAGDYSLKIWDLATRREVMEIPVDAPVFWIEVSPDQRRLVTGHLPTQMGSRFGTLGPGHYRVWRIDGMPALDPRPPAAVAPDSVWGRHSSLAREHPP